METKAQFSTHAFANLILANLHEYSCYLLNDYLCLIHRVSPKTWDNSPFSRSASNWLFDLYSNLEVKGVEKKVSINPSAREFFCLHSIFILPGDFAAYARAGLHIRKTLAEKILGLPNEVITLEV